MFIDYTECTTSRRALSVNNLMIL